MTDRSFDSRRQFLGMDGDPLIPKDQWRNSARPGFEFYAKIYLH